MYEITTIGDPLLRSVAVAVHDFKHAKQVAENMAKQLTELSGAGLAAPQVGIPLAVAIVQVRPTALFPDREATPLLTLINPAILEYSDDTESGWEGCFSIPGYLGRVRRPKTVKVRYCDAEGDEHIHDFSGYVARVIQHECDHLNGKFYLDRMDTMEDFVTQHNYKQFVLNVR